VDSIIDLWWWAFYGSILLSAICVIISPFPFAQRNDGRLVAGLSMLAVAMAAGSCVVLIWTGRL